MQVQQPHICQVDLPPGIELQKVVTKVGAKRIVREAENSGGIIYHFIELSRVVIKGRQKMLVDNDVCHGADQGGSFTGISGASPLHPDTGNDFSHPRSDMI